MKRIHVVILIILFIVLVILVLGIYKFNFKNDDIFIKNSEGKVEQINIHDGTYKIAGEKVTLKNGISEVEATPGSNSKIVTKYFGNDLKIDLNKDGVDDLVFLVTQETGGSGVYYYTLALLNTQNGKVGSEGILLGDRIAPQNTEKGKGNIVVVNYADRKPGESFAVAPSFGKSLWLLLDTKTMQFGEVAQNFEGEADVFKMTLGMKTWNWINTIYSDDKIVKPIKADKFSITFKNNKTFSATTDCNGVGGEYAVNGNKISFTKMMSTLMYCDGSQESDFSKMLSETGSYMFTSKGELVLLLKYDSGSVIFK